MRPLENELPRSRRQYFFNPRNGNITYGKSYGEFSYNGVPIDSKMTDLESESFVLVNDAGEVVGRGRARKVPEPVYNQILNSRYKVPAVRSMGKQPDPVNPKSGRDVVRFKIRTVNGEKA
jgi:hypothetical protein